jgi:hypothetical protein
MSESVVLVAVAVSVFVVLLALAASSWSVITVVRSASAQQAGAAEAVADALRDAAHDVAEALRQQRGELDDGTPAVATMADIMEAWAAQHPEEAARIALANQAQTLEVGEADNWEADLQPFPGAAVRQMKEGLRG